MKTLYDLPAPAKLNLFLHITGRRDDGYHLLQSVFMLIDWCDTLHVELRGDGGLSREDLTVPLPEDDLILRAARALQPFARPGQGAHITIDKQVPAQAGMGGGSSDAATCLLALNRLWDLRLPRSTLAGIGLSLGADVPFFLGGHHAWVEGIGERMTPIALPAARFVVVKPAAGIDTRDIFMAPDLERATPAAILSGFAAGRIDQAFGFGHNDLQPVAQRLCPEVSEAIEWLGRQGYDARMTGSGSAVFAPMNTAAGSASDNPPHEAEFAMLPQGLADSPVQQPGCSSPEGLGGLKVKAGSLQAFRRDVYRLMVQAVDPCRGVAKLVKALDFDSSMQRFESFLPCQNMETTAFGPWCRKLR